jgi:hypothetical protein
MLASLPAIPSFTLILTNSSGDDVVVVNSATSNGAWSTAPIANDVILTGSDNTRQYVATSESNANEITGQILLSGAQGLITITFDRPPLGLGGATGGATVKSTSGLSLYSYVNNADQINPTLNVQFNIAPANPT